MTSPSLFNMMEFSPQQMNFQDNMFGLSADLFADDLYTEGSILDLGLDGGLKPLSATQQSLEDLLFQDNLGDSFGEEWMESVDVHSLLDTRVTEQTEVIEATPVELEPEPRKEGMKAAAFELLKALLTSQQPVKIDKALSLQLPKAEEVIAPVAVSPVAEVPNLDFPGCDTINVLLEETPAIQSFEDLIEIQPEISLSNGDVVEITPHFLLENNLAMSVEESGTVWSANDDSFTTDGSTLEVSSPYSSEDSDSIFSSSPTSPSGFSTIDTSFLRESNSKSVKGIQVSSEDFTRLKSKSRKAKNKSCPYDSDVSVSDKKLRKKVQNKNAATRYRVKKRNEKETLQEQEVRLADKNKQLREKVESLQREILYMKELMTEINKAKRSKI